MSELFNYEDTVCIKEANQGRWLLGAVYTVKEIHGKSMVTDERGARYPANGGTETFTRYVVTETCGDIFEDQRRFMHSMGQQVSKFNKDQVALYLRLTCEELGEAMYAASPSKKEQIKALFAQLQDLCHVEDNYDELELFDGLEDVLVTTIGAGISANLPMRQGWNEVLLTNLAKVNPKTGLVKRREDGKVLKPDNWVGPTEKLRIILANR